MKLWFEKEMASVNFSKPPDVICMTMEDLAVKMICRLLLILSFCLLAPISYGEHSIIERKAKEALEYVTPEEVGWSTEKLEEAKDYAGRIGSAAVMALYDGKVFFSWGSTSRKYMCHSISDV